MTNDERADAAYFPSLQTASSHGPRRRVLDARPDTADFRDKNYIATLTEVPVHLPLDRYAELQIPILDQGEEGACTGYALATVAHYLLRVRKVVPDDEPVSARMFYEMAKRHDEWSGERYEGSSARGAIKGWHKHGVCSERAWPNREDGTPAGLNDGRVVDAASRPLGAYFRVNHKSIVDMHAALAEVGILYVTSVVHNGWKAPPANGHIEPAFQSIGAHAFVIVGFDERGFWIQNSWDTDWGAAGYAHVTYDDWLRNGTDVWVARLGVPIKLTTKAGVATARSAVAERYESFSFRDLRPHIVSISNEGRFGTSGTYGTTRSDVVEIFEQDFSRITKSWKKKRLLLYAHGGLNDEQVAVQRIADYAPQLLATEIYPLAFVWHTDYWTTLCNSLEDAVRRRRPEGILDAAKQFMFDRIDDALEPIARKLTGKAEWSEMKGNALLATTSEDGAARFVAEQIAKLCRTDSTVEVHLVSHSAGSIIHAPLVQLLSATGRIKQGPMKGNAGLGVPIESCTLWAPACSVELFKATYLATIKNIARMALFSLTDSAEQDDDCGGVYHKSLLYLVSNAFEDKPRVPMIRDGQPVLGMEKFIRADAELVNLFDGGSADWVRAPNDNEPGTPFASRARRHGQFDDDRATLRATLSRVLDIPRFDGDFALQRDVRNGRRPVEN